MSEADKERIAKFLVELTELTKRHQIEIGGCFCCGSPYLLVDFDPQKAADNLDWDAETETYKLKTPGHHKPA